MPGNRGLEVAIREHDSGILAAELQRHRPHPGGGGLHDGRAGCGLAGEGDRGDAGVPGE
jgi:hypothetical protein